MSKYDISVVIPAHKEGRLAQHTMNSVIRAIAYAKEYNVKSEIIIILDRPDKKTRSFFSMYKKTEICFETVDFGDAGLARNFGVKQASAEYIAFIDADNLFCQNWLYKAFDFIKKNNKNIIVHPEYNIVFEDQNLIWRQISSRNPLFKVENMIENNYWDTTCLTQKEILLKFPYQATLSDPGFGHEDWYFNCETLAAGIEHYIVPDTAFFLRRKRTGSVMAYANSTNRVIGPSKLFEPAVFSNLIKKYKLVNER